MTLEMQKKYARLAVRRGLNVQPGQPVVIRSAVSDAAFVRLCVEEAYEAGAGRVEVDWRDMEISRLGYTYRTKESLSEIPQWFYDQTKDRQDDGACFLNIISDPPGGLKGVDPEKIQAYQSAFSRKMEPLNKYMMNSEGQWCVIGLPSKAWAQVVFPDLDPDAAYEKLEQAIYDVSHVREDNDPMAEWEAHDRELLEQCQWLNEQAFTALHFTSELGTDLTVGLVGHHFWCGGADTTAKGIVFDPNIPTEEVFSMPHKDQADGVVYASKPLNYNGKLIEGFWLRFENGKVVDFGAEKEQETLQQLLDFDEGARRLGEVALVPYDSPISKSGILFYNTLYDENAACHLALGRPYPENIEGGTSMSDEEMAAAGANASMVHEDFMFGTRQMRVEGIRADGTVIPVFENGNFSERRC